MTQRIEPVGTRRDLAPAEPVHLLTPVERELERERRERKRRAQPRRKPSQGGSEGGRLDVRG